MSLLRNQSSFVYLIYLIAIIIIIISSLLCEVNTAPAFVNGNGLCEVKLFPKDLISSKYKSKPIMVRCEAEINQKLTQIKANFYNPVFDLSFGGSPRTGVFFIRGNVSCDSQKTKCWSEFLMSTNNLNELIINDGRILFLCQVADNIKSFGNEDMVIRCDNNGTLMYKKDLSFGETCSLDDSTKECGENLACQSDPIQIRKYSCGCNGNQVAVKSNEQTICVNPVKLGSSCNNSEECRANDPNSECRIELNGNKCKCFSDYEPVSSRDNQRLKCKSLKSDKITEGIDYEDEDYENVKRPTEPLIRKITGEDATSNRKVKPTKPPAASTHFGLIIFLVVILLAIIIVAIIIRVKQNSDKRIITPKKRNEQTDGSQSEQTKPILQGQDEVDLKNQTTEKNGKNIERSKNDINSSKTDTKTKQSAV